MTIAEKRIAVKNECSKHLGCDGCPVNEVIPYTESCFDSNEKILRAYDIMFGGEQDKPETTTHDPVNHPPHYCREDGMECIDEMVLIYGAEAVMHYCLCNIHKYRYRAANKNGEEDLKKSDWYMWKYKELKEKSGL